MGKLLFTVDEPYRKLPVTEADKQAVKESFSRDAQGRRFFTENRHRFRYSETKPAIKNFLEYDQLIYVETWNRKDGKTEFYVFGQDGKLKKRIFIPIEMIDYRRSYPYFIDGGQFYQLVENEDEEEWELNVINLERL